MSLLRTRPLLQLLATLGPGSAKTKDDRPPQPTARFRPVAPNRSGVYSRTEDRAASTRRQHIPGHRAKDTPDGQEYAADALMQLDPRFGYTLLSDSGPQA